ncbi:bestrophin family protein, partial [Spirosoma sp. 48-14]
ETIGVFILTNLLFVLRHYIGLEILSVPIAIPALLGTGISLLLAFRTNQSYERWWEARNIWGSIVNDSRTLIRQLLTFLPEKSIEISRVAARRQVGWCYVLGHSLRGQPTQSLLDAYIPAQDQIHNPVHPPLAILQAHANQFRQLYQEGYLTDFQLIQLDSTLSRLTDAMGRCERIKNTVFPKTYTFYLQVFILLFTALLPFGFVEDLFFIEVPVVTVIAAAFFLIEKSAIRLQDPFENRPTDTPVHTIAQGIERSVYQLVDLPLPEHQATPQTYYTL